MNEVNRKIKMSEKHVCLVLNIHTYSIDWSLETCLMWHFSCSSGVERENKTNFEIFPTGKMCWAHWIPDFFRNRRLIIFRFFFFCLIFLLDGVFELMCWNTKTHSKREQFGLPKTWFYLFESGSFLSWHIEI